MEKLETVSKLAKRISFLFILRALRQLNPYFAGFAVVAIALGISLNLPTQTASSSAGIIFLMSILAVASVWGVRPALLASVLASLAFDFFFFPPFYSFEINDWRDVLSTSILLIGCCVVTFLAENLRRKTFTARMREILAKRLNAISQRLGSADKTSEIARQVVAGIGVTVGAKAILLMVEGDSLRMLAAHPRNAKLTAGEEEAAMRCRNRTLPQTPANDCEQVSCTPVAMDAASNFESVLVIGPATRRSWRLPDRTRVINLFANQASAAFQRVTFLEQIQEARIAAETEKLRSALLTSISHDLKSPLSLILGSASSLQALKEELSESSKAELLSSIIDEAERLDRFIGHLLDMSQVESEAVRPKLQPVDISEVIGSLIKRTAHSVASHRVVLKVTKDLPPISADPVLLERVLFNILENAAKYTPAGRSITIAVSKETACMTVQISDEGPGIGESDLPHLFEKFYRGQQQGSRVPGTGLGLAICRGFLQAMGGSISASNLPARQGAAFTIRLPLASKLDRVHYLDATLGASSPLN